MVLMAAILCFSFRGKSLTQSQLEAFRRRYKIHTELKVALEKIMRHQKAKELWQRLYNQTMVGI